MVRRAVLCVALAAALFGAVGSATPAHAGVPYRDPVFASWTRTSDITYGSAVNSAGELQSLELDIYEPTGDVTAARPVYIWVHGGFFIRGTKEGSIPASVQDYARAGWVVISIEYRLRPELPEGAAAIVAGGAVLDALGALIDGQHDAQAAVRWARANAAAWRLDPNRIAIGGHSAGALIADSVNFNEHDPGTSGNPGYSSRVAAAVVHAGGGLPLAQAQPGLGDPPIMFLHAVDDTIVPFAISPPMCALAVALLVPCEFVVRPGGEHDTFGTERALDFLYRRVILGQRAPLLRLTTYPGP